MKTLTIEVEESYSTERFEVPDEAEKPLLEYMMRHQNLLPFATSAAVFLTHWRVGVNLCQTQSYHERSHPIR